MTMDVFKSFRLFGLYLYVSSIRMKRRRTIDEKMRNQRKVLLKKKNFCTSNRTAVARCAAGTLVQSRWRYITWLVLERILVLR